MDTCPTCKSTFPRKYIRKGQRKVFCSRQCRTYVSEIVETRTCKTCGKQFGLSRLGVKRNRDFCSRECVARNPCQICGKMITGRNIMNGRVRAYCSRLCGAIANRTITGRKQYVHLAYMACLCRHGILCCERCGIQDTEVLVAHHQDGKKNGIHKNLEVLCANCHHKLHFGPSYLRSTHISRSMTIFERLGKEKLSELLINLSVLSEPISR